MKPYKNMTGGLFEGKPLEVVNDPGRDIRAQQIANSLESIVTGRCAITERLWEAIWERAGHDGEPPEGWFETVRERAWFAQDVAKAATEKNDDGDEFPARGKIKAKVFHDGLMDIARSLLK